MPPAGRKTNTKHHRMTEENHQFDPTHVLVVTTSGDTAAEATATAAAVEAVLEDADTLGSLSIVTLSRPIIRTSRADSSARAVQPRET